MAAEEKAASRVWRACKNCRIRKIRCNGELPCAMCLQKREECTYTETKDRAANSRHYVAQLESRLAQAEASLSQISPAQQGSSNHATTHQSAAIEPDDAEVDDLAHDFSHIAVDRRGELRYIGGSGMATLVDALGPDLPFVHSATSLSGSGRSDWLPRPTDFGFPPRDILMRLVDIYFRKIHPLHPILNQTSFMRKFSQGGDALASDTPFVALLFAICAASSVLVPGYGTPASVAVGNEWLERASILHYRCARETAPIHCQILSVISSYLAAINDMPAAWLITGQAMRIAQDLGLHRATSKLRMSPADMQERRRIFWCLYGQDRDISFALGRSMAIDDVDIDVELPFDLDEEEISQCTSLADVKPNVRPSLMSGFIALTQLHIIARKAKRAHRVFDHLADTADPANFAALQRLCEPLDTALSRWLESLPACIRESSEEAYDSTFFRQSIQCYMQFQSTRMNSFRPVISGARSTQCFGVNDAGASLYFSKVLRSASAAAGLGTVIRRNLHGHELAFAVEQTLLAGVLLARSIPLCKEDEAASTTAKAAQTCVVSLAALETWPGAARCREILDDLVTRVVVTHESQSQWTAVSPKSLKRAAHEAFSSRGTQGLWVDETVSAPIPNKRQASHVETAPFEVPLFEPMSSFDFAFSLPMEQPTISAEPQVPSGELVDLSGLPFPGLDFLIGDSNATWDAGTLDSEYTL